jgi:H+/Cl- antiporter ClcA
MQLMHVVASTFGDGPNKLGRDYLIATMFMKILTLSISLGFGFIGGQIFPCIFIGTCAGTIATIVSGVPIIVTVPCFMVAVPGAFCPIPFTLVGITMVSLVLGNELSCLVFVSVIFSFMTACGTGVIQRILKKVGRSRKKFCRGKRYPCSCWRYVPVLCFTQSSHCVNFID